MLMECLQCGDIENKEHWINIVHKVHGDVLCEGEKKRAISGFLKNLECL
ncbi:hypothetical protein VCR6J2_470044 [Vibrio coralliirubri]|nr:hypothetical protein VCR6J2_470044 [Vibrio coralliirubri]